MTRSLRHSLFTHWPEYLMEAAGPAALMLAIALHVALFDLPDGPMHVELDSSAAHRVVKYATVGVVLLAMIYSPWGQRSGAHFNPAVTLAFWRLGKVGGADAAFYVTAQVLGAVLGGALAIAVLEHAVGIPIAEALVTSPRADAYLEAFAAEAAVGLVLMTVILVASNDRRLVRATPLAAALVLATGLVLVAPASGGSANPARSLGAAVPASMWAGIWIYLLAPTVGAAIAATGFRVVRGAPVCAKLHHHNGRRCIFH